MGFSCFLFTKDQAKGFKGLPGNSFPYPFFRKHFKPTFRFSTADYAKVNSLYSLLNCP